MDGGSSDGDKELTQLGDDLLRVVGHPQGELQAERDGVVTQTASVSDSSHVIPNVVDQDEAEQDQDETPPLVQRRSKRQPHPTKCGTGSHKISSHARNK